MADAASASPVDITTATGTTPDFRKVVLNALVWIAKVEIPEGGIESTVTAELLKANLDPK